MNYEEIALGKVSPEELFCNLKEDIEMLENILNHIASTTYYQHVLSYYPTIKDSRTKSGELYVEYGLVINTLDIPEQFFHHRVDIKAFQEVADKLYPRDGKHIEFFCEDKMPLYHMILNPDKVRAFYINSVYDEYACKFIYFSIRADISKLNLNEVSFAKWYFDKGIIGSIIAELSEVNSIVALSSTYVSHILLLFKDFTEPLESYSDYILTSILTSSETGNLVESFIKCQDNGEVEDTGKLKIKGHYSRSSYLNVMVVYNDQDFYYEQYVPNNNVITDKLGVLDDILFALRVFGITFEQLTPEHLQCLFNKSSYEELLCMYTRIEAEILDKLLGYVISTKSVAKFNS